MPWFSALLQCLFIAAYAHPTSAAASPPWGTLRPHALISARAPVPHSPYFGFAYHTADSLDIRHIVADAESHLKFLSWSRHDGSNFGDQHIHDSNANLAITASFVAHPSQSACAIRFSASPLDESKPIPVISVIMYAVVAPEEVLSSAKTHPSVGSLHFDTSVPSSPDQPVRINGNASSVGGRFSIRVLPPTSGSVDTQLFEKPPQKQESDHSLNVHGTGSRSRLRRRAQRQISVSDDITFFQVSADNAEPHQAWDIESLLKRKLSRTLKFPLASTSVRLLDNKPAAQASVLFVQRLVQAPFQLDASLVVTEDLTPAQISSTEDGLSGEKLDSRLVSWRDIFDTRFEQVFNINKDRNDTRTHSAAKHALSNLLGGIGYFYGSSIFKEEHASDKSAAALPPVGLLTATPSRFVFPRGFLWDEGFHQMVIQRWDPSLSTQCLLTWLRASQSNGWIPREQILGLEARGRFPAHVKHLMVQNPSIANPPTILMPIPMLTRFMKGNDASASQKEDWERHSHALLDQAARYYEWLKASQSGEREHSFRWRGRSTTAVSPSGYPLTLSSGLDDYPRALSVSERERHVDLHSWVTWAARSLAQMSESNGRNASKFWKDYELLKGSLEEHHARSAQGKNREDLLLCDYDGDHRVCHEGYATILPLLLGILDPDDERVSMIFDALEDESLLRATAGVRSLSKSDNWYRKGDDYWTGSVWMPFNFLTLAALKTKYSVEEGPYRERALKLYTSLRESIIDNTIRVYTETGQLWENYSPDIDGAGKSGRQFTGWTSLILLIMAEMFDGVM